MKASIFSLLAIANLKFPQKVLVNPTNIRQGESKIKIFLNIIFIIFIFFAFSNLYSQSCGGPDDLVISPGRCSKFDCGYVPEFQAVQSVWADSGSNDIFGQWLNWDCTSLKMIQNKPTLLFGTSNWDQQRDFISLTVFNYFAVTKSFRVRFSILKELETEIWTSEIYTINAGIPRPHCNILSRLDIHIPAPLTHDILGNNYFTFSETGIVYIKMELVETNGTQIPDADPANQVIKLKCDVKESRYIPVTVIPLIFNDKYFSNDSTWFQRIQEDMNFVYDVLPVPDHDIVMNIKNGGNAPLVPGIGNFSYWETLTPEGKIVAVGEDFRKFSYMQKLSMTTKLILMVDQDAANPSPPPDYIGYLHSSFNASGLGSPAFPGTYMIEWNCTNPAGTIAHEISHVFGIWTLPGVGGPGEEYNILGNRLPVYGYRVKTREYKNHDVGTPMFCLMGDKHLSDDEVWIHKKDYKDLITNFTNPIYPDPEVICLSGTIDKNNNNTIFLPSYKFFSTEIDVDSLVSQGRYLIKLKNNLNQILKQYGFNTGGIYESTLLLAAEPFILNVPTRAGLKKIEICDSLGAVLAVRNISDNSPNIDVQFPANGQINSTDSVYIGWNSSDPDGDTLYHAIFYSVENNESGNANWLPVEIDVKGNHYNWRTRFVPNLNYRVKVYVTDGYNTAVDSSDGNFIIGTPSNITFAPEGFYNITSQSLNMKDTARIYLRNIFAPYSIVDSGKTVLDSVTLTGNLFFKIAPTGTYYIVVKHRNSIETWSKSGGESYTTGTAFNYDFTSAAAQAYGNNLIQKGTKFCLFSGDVNQDGVVDLSDLSLIDNDAYGFVSGYVKTDLTGDDFVDLGDLSIADNNAFNFVSKITP